MEDKNNIVLKTDKELKVVMSPIRQKIIRLMSRQGYPVTAKYIADSLSISPSSAQHHVKKLQEVGIIEFDHDEFINGIRARYFILSQKTISIGQDIEDDLAAERDVLARSILSNTYNDYKKVLTSKRKLLTEEWRQGNRMGDQMSGVVHLTQEKANELFEIMDSFIRRHSKAGVDTHPFEYTFIAFRADLDKEEMDKHES